jgi:putative transferase (TIGR04331 family)
MSKINLLLSSHDNIEGKKVLNINYSCCDFFLKKNLRNKFLQNRWHNIQKRESDVKKIFKISSEISLLLKKKLDKDNLPNNYWKFIIEPWVRAFVTTVFDKLNYIKLLKKNTIYKVNNYKFDNTPCFNSDLDFKREANKDYFNHELFIKILTINPFKNKILIKNAGSRKKNDFEKNSILNDNKKKFSFNLNFYKFFFKKNAFIFNYIHFPRIEYLKLCFKLNVFPIHFINFFKNNFNFKNKTNNNLRNEIKKFLILENKNKKIEIFLELVVDYLPLNYLENYNLIRSKIKVLSKYVRNKYIIDSSFSEHNEIFRTFLVFSKLKKNYLINISHGGGLESKMAPLNFYLNKNIFNDIILWNKENNYKKNIKILPATKKIVKKKIDYNTNKSKLTIFFAESYKHIFDVHNFPSFQDCNLHFDKICKAFKKINPEIKKNLIFRNKINAGSYTTSRFYENLNIKNKVINDYFESISKSRISVICYPQTVLSEVMFLNVPLILLYNYNKFNLNNKSKIFFKLMKKNNIAFDCPIKAKIHIEKIWANPKIWWFSKKIQKIRNLYLEKFFLSKKNWFEYWEGYFKNIKKN